jgi:thiol-disulfide isomerase/thioredoxin
MKIRTGFVSNSSSSSFVLLVEKEVIDNYANDYCPHCKRGNTEFYFDSEAFTNHPGSCSDNAFRKITIKEKIEELEESITNFTEKMSDARDNDFHWISDTIEIIEKQLEFYKKLTQDKYYELAIDISYHEKYSGAVLKEFIDQYKDKIRIIMDETGNYFVDDEYKEITKLLCY